MVDLNFMGLNCVQAFWFDSGEELYVKCKICTSCDLFRWDSAACAGSESLDLPLHTAVRLSTRIVLASPQTDSAQEQVRLEGFGLDT